MKSIISDAYFSGEEISPIVQKLEGALLDTKRGPAIVALLSICITLQNPELTEEQLHDAVRDTSRYICLLIESDSTFDDSGDVKKRMN